MRTIEEIQKEYADLCAKAGHLNYQIYVLSSDLEDTQLKLKELNQEAASVSKAKEENKNA